jgi:hypothetical protein
MYYKELEHATKYCLQLIVKWKERGKQNLNQNQNLNIQMIATEEHDDHPRIEIVMCGRTRIGVDAMENEKGMEKWIRKVVEANPTFNPWKEKETCQQDRKEILGLY